MEKDLRQGDTSGPDQAHPYHRRKLGCPCPGLATMINHSYLKPKDVDQQISVWQVMVGMVECYNLSYFFAAIFAIVGTLRLGKIFGFSLRELAVHGKIEHDASLTRFDVDKGNALDPNFGLIESFLGPSSDQSSATQRDKANNKAFVSLEDFAKKRVELESQLTEFKSQSLAEINFLGRGEACLALQIHRTLPPNKAPLSKVAQTDLIALSDWLRVWYAEERLPVELGWKKPSKSIGLFGTLQSMSRMKSTQKQIKTKN